MKKAIIITALAAITLSCINKPVNTTNADLDQWIGSWVGDYEGGKFYENWEKKSDDLYEATGYWIMKGDTLLTELLRVEKIGNHWAYIACINGGKPIMFPLKSNENGKWVFENKEHDFPQRIIYQLQKDGKLFAKVEGKMNKKEVVEEYMYTRIN